MAFDLADCEKVSLKSLSGKGIKGTVYVSFDGHQTLTISSDNRAEAKDKFLFKDSPFYINLKYWLNDDGKVGYRAYGSTVYDLAKYRDNNQAKLGLHEAFMPIASRYLKDQRFLSKSIIKRQESELKYEQDKLALAQLRIKEIKSQIAAETKKLRAAK